MRGLSRFYTGKPCAVGHITERFVSNRQCVACNAEKARQRERQRSERDPAYRMYRNVQRRSGQALRGSASPVQALGCTHEELARHIEAKFTEGMEWSRYGQWEVDHIIPLSATTNEAELVRLCHFTNLQPLWRRDNLLKACKLPSVIDGCDSSTGFVRLTESHMGHAKDAHLQQD